MARRSGSRRTVLGVSAGIDAFLGGIGFVFGQPAVWGYASVPILVALVLGCGLGVGGIQLARNLSARIVDGSSLLASLGQGTLIFLLSCIFLVLSALMALALAQPLSGWALEAIAGKQEKAMTGHHHADLGFFASLWIGVRCALFILIVGGFLAVALFVVDFLFPPALIFTVPLRLVLGGWLLAWDLLDYPLGMRGMGVSARMGWFVRHLGAVTAFGVCWSLVVVIPGIFLLLLPMGVAGATRLVVAAEDSRQ